MKDSKYVKTNSVNPFHLIFSNVNGYFEEINKSKYLTIAPANESEEKIKKKHEKLSSKIRHFIRPITKKPDDYDETYMKIKFNSDHDMTYDLGWMSV